MLCFSLSLIRNFEAPLEMAFAKYKADKRWTYVWVVEIVKVLVKIALLARRRGKMVVRQGHPLRSHLNTIPNFSKVEGGQPQAARPAERASSGWPTLLAELLHIGRPLVQLAALRSHGDQSWKPFLLALSCDLSSRVFSGMEERTVSERNELNRRAVCLMWYLLREPLWGSLQERLAFLNVLLEVPLLGFGAKVRPACCSARFQAFAFLLTWRQLTKDILDQLTRFWFFTSST